MPLQRMRDEAELLSSVSGLSNGRQRSGSREFSKLFSMGSSRLCFNHARLEQKQSTGDRKRKLATAMIMSGLKIG